MTATAIPTRTEPETLKRINGQSKNKRTMDLMPLLQMTDSTFPVGTFSFSNGLETASHLGIVHDAATLEQYTRSVARQGAFSDGVAALMAYRSALKGDLEGIENTDRELMLFKMNDEARMMLQRMGKKLAELSVKLFPNDRTIAAWLEDIRSEKTPGTYPVAQGLAFASSGLNEEALFASHQYGVINMVLSAALRCVRVSHYDTQLILQRLCAESDALYAEAREMGFEDMNSFVPEMDIFASLHEKGNMRMFMN